jgi:hypothetical protein
MANSPEESVDFRMEKQEQSNWCWAATAKSVSTFYYRASQFSQCLVVSTVFRNPNCCNDPDSQNCNKPEKLSPALTVTGNLVNRQPGTVPWSTIKGEILAGRVVGARIEWKDGSGGHFLVIRGVGGIGRRTKQLFFNDPKDEFDPENPYKVSTYRTFKNNAESKWTDTYFTTGGNTPT